jgi:type II secretory ATPase GspE/PulE/Tfp pilus assembly ATPase PilB-like protein
MGIEQFLMSASVNVLMAQRLVRKLCQKCKKPLEVTPLMKSEIDLAMKTMPKEYLDEIDVNDFKLFQPHGCQECGNIGYKGRFGIYEVLPMLNELQEILFSKKPAHLLYEAASKFGVITMKQDGVIKALRGETTLEEVLRVTTE